MILDLFYDASLGPFDKGDYILNFGRRWHFFFDTFKSH